MEANNLDSFASLITKHHSRHSIYLQEIYSYQAIVYSFKVRL